MANIIPLKDSAGAQFYPQTHEKAVIDSNGVNLQTKLASITTPTYVTAWDGASTPIVANIPAGVSVTYNTTTYTGTLAASASTANKTYLVSTGTTDNYNRYVTQLNGSTYSWQNLGSTEIDLSDYATKAELSELDQEVFGLETVSINTTDYELVIGCVYQTQYRVAGNYGTYQRSRFIPVGDYKGRTIRIVPKSATVYTSIVAVTAAPSLEENSNLSLATGWTGEIQITSQQDIVVPSNAEYFIFYIEDLRYPTTVRDPQSMTVLGSEGAVVLRDQGIGNAGKYMAVGNDGKVVPVSVTPSPGPTPTPSGNAVEKVETKTIYLGNNIASLDTLGAGWSGSVADGFTHSSGNTAPLTLNSTIQGTSYIITISGTAGNENAYTVKIGDGYEVDPYNGQTTQYAGIKSDGGKVIITPASSFAGTINVKVQPIVTEESAAETLQLSVLNVDAGLMESNISGFWNVAIGPDETTLGDCENATRCIAIGHEALRDIVSGSRNVAIGTFPCSSLKNGKGNVAIGADTYFLRTGGEYNIAIGVAAIGGTGSAVNHNVAIGMTAGSMATGDNNICIGKSAGYKATSDGIYIGELAGYNLTGVKNICIGRNAGYQAGSIAGNWNTLIGPSVQSTNGASKSTAIGFQAVIEKSSQVVLGGTDCVEIKMFGDVVVRGTDAVVRKLKFNNDNTVTWETVS